MARSIFKIFDLTVIGVLIFCSLHKSTIATSPCTFREDLIQEYDNSGGTTSIEVESQDSVGIDRSVSTSIGGSQSSDNSKSRGSEVEASASVNAWFFSASVRAQITESSTSSNSNSSSWAKASDDTWKEQKTRTSKYSVPPGFKVRLYQEVAQCGEFTVRNSKIRREDEDATPPEILEKNRQLGLGEIVLGMHQVHVAHVKDMAEIDAGRRKNDQEHILKNREFDERQMNANNTKHFQDQMLAHITGNQNKSLEFANKKYIFEKNHTHHASIQLSILKHQQEIERKSLEIAAGKKLWDLPEGAGNTNRPQDVIFEDKSLSENASKLFIGILLFFIALVILICSGMIYCFCCGYKKLGGQGKPNNFPYPMKLNPNINIPASYPLMEMYAHARNPYHESQDDSGHQLPFHFGPLPAPPCPTSPPTTKMISTCYKPLRIEP